MRTNVIDLKQPVSSSGNCGSTLDNCTQVLCKSMSTPTSCTLIAKMLGLCLVCCLGCANGIDGQPESRMPQWLQDNHHFDKGTATRELSADENESSFVFSDIDQVGVSGQGCLRVFFGEHLFPLKLGLRCGFVNVPK